MSDFSFGSDRIDVTQLPVEKRREVLGSLQAKTTIQLDGREIPFILNGATFDFAEQAGIDLGEQLSGQLLEESFDPKANVMAIAKILYSGAIPFGEDISIAEIKMRLPLDTLDEIVEQVFPEGDDLSEGQIERMEDTTGKDLSSLKDGTDASATRSARSRGTSAPSRSSS